MSNKDPWDTVRAWLNKMEMSDRDIMSWIVEFDGLRRAVHEIHSLAPPEDRKIVRQSLLEDYVFHMISNKHFNLRYHSHKGSKGKELNKLIGAAYRLRRN